jgi:hypothetical protein
MTGSRLPYYTSFGTAAENLRHELMKTLGDSNAESGPRLH